MPYSSFRRWPGKIIRNDFSQTKTVCIETVRNIIQRYPQHQFILVGDSGEKDPEVYAQIYADFLDTIQHTLIRKINGTDISMKIR